MWLSPRSNEKKLKEQAILLVWGKKKDQTGNYYTFQLSKRYHAEKELFSISSTNINVNIVIEQNLGRQIWV